MEERLVLESCDEITFYTAIILATGLISDPYMSWFPSSICWNSVTHDKAGFGISNAFINGYLLEDWK
jgi:hypothetical protein